MKRSAMLLLREPKARFIGRSPASFFMRVSALHFHKTIVLSMKRLLRKHEAARCATKHSLRSHEAKRDVTSP